MFEKKIENVTLEARGVGRVRLCKAPVKNSQWLSKDKG